jgi:hypothetical protein
MTNDTGNGRSISVKCVHPALVSSTPAELNEHTDGLPVDPLRPASMPVTAAYRSEIGSSARRQQLRRRPVRFPGAARWQPPHGDIDACRLDDP